MKVVLQPCGNKDSRQHYVDTIENKVKLADHDELRALVEAELFPSGEAAVWGVTPGKNNTNVSKYNKASTGDVVLFFKNKELFASGVIAYKLHSSSLARRLWGVNSDNMTWEYIYVLDELKNMSISQKDFNIAAGYKENFITQGFSVLDDDRSLNILEIFKLESEVYTNEFNQEDFKQAVKKFDEGTELNKEVKSTARVEQGYLRNYLFKNSKVSNCSICHKEFPVQFLIAAHIKKRAHCTNEEKIDAENIVMSACRLGCDDLFERGYITIGDGGTVERSATKTFTPILNDYVTKIEGNICSAYSKGSHKYFKWHSKYHS
ncbi:hypothetical protein [Halobacteriovorax sp. DPLXC-1]|uniref:hypothetical protein n=1 Tax=Halobacteriovorax sp. DPLXC-1 TaxID=3110771 RepID=UPI002FEE89A1